MKSLTGKRRLRVTDLGWSSASGNKGIYAGQGRANMHSVNQGNAQAQGAQGGFVSLNLIGACKYLVAGGGKRTSL